MPVTQELITTLSTEMDKMIKACDAEGTSSSDP